MTVWNIAKWPVLLVIVVLIVGLLYWAHPERPPAEVPLDQRRRRRRHRGLDPALRGCSASTSATSRSYDKTYGSLAGVIVFLLWLWITNLALLFGAELDAELERGRELQAGIEAEETVQLPPRDTRNIEKAEKKRAEDVARVASCGSAPATTTTRRATRWSTAARRPRTGTRTADPRPRRRRRRREEGLLGRLRRG